jgi:hypothetical protein
MTTLRKYPLLFFLILAALLLATFAVHAGIAQSAAPPPYEITWWTIDGGGGGGGNSPVNGYTLEGTIAQPDAAFIEQSPYQLSAGYWGGGFESYWLNFLPVILR